MSSSSHRSSPLQNADWLTGPEEGGNLEPQRTKSNKSVADEILPQVKPTRATLGLNPDPPVDHEHLETEQATLRWSRIRIVLREPFAEFWGTFILIMFGCGSIAQVLLTAGYRNAPGLDGFGNYQSINWGYVILSISPSLPCLWSSALERIYANDRQLGHRPHAWRLRCRRLRRLPQSRRHFDQLPLSQTSVEAFPHILSRTIPWGVHRRRRRVRKLCFRH